MLCIHVIFLLEVWPSHFYIRRLIWVFIRRQPVLTNSSSLLIFSDQSIIHQDFNFLSLFQGYFNISTERQLVSAFKRTAVPFEFYYCHLLQHLHHSLCDFQNKEVNNQVKNLVMWFNLYDDFSSVPPRKINKSS